MNDSKRSKFRLRITQYANLIFLLFGIWLLSKHILYGGVILILFWYCLFGFLGISRMFYKLRLFKTALVLQTLTFPYLLIPSFKAWYYLQKVSLNLLRFKRKMPKGNVLLDFINKHLVRPINKIRVQNFITDDEKILYWVMVARINFMTNQWESSDEALYKAECLTREENKNYAWWISRIEDFKMHLNK